VFTSLPARRLVMKRQSSKQRLIVVMALTATLTGHSQTGRSNEPGLFPNLKETMPRLGSKSIRVPLPLQFSADGPADPTDPSRPLFCNKDVQREFGEAFMKTRNGEERNGLAEAGRSIEFDGNALSFGSWATTDIDDGEAGERANKMSVSRDDHSIAVFHTHGNKARPVPSDMDLRGDVPNYVVSRFAVYVTVPGTGTYNELHPAECK
jgi:hypothetical protein